MKDLYRRLDIRPTASKDEIAAALDQHPDLQAYAAILLDEDRRSQYDRVHGVLKMIGTLRFKLDLDKSDTWFITRYRDFAIMPKPAFVSAPQDTADDEAAKAGGGKKRGKKWWLFAVVAVLLAAAVFAVLTLR
jgi:hypothetical protein